MACTTNTSHNLWLVLVLVDLEDRHVVHSMYNLKLWLLVKPLYGLPEAGGDVVFDIRITNAYVEYHIMW